MRIKLMNSLPALERKHIEDIERHFGRTLPEDYAQFLLTFNGGEAIPDADYMIRTDIRQQEIDGRSGLVRDCVEEFFGFLGKDQQLADFEGPNFLLGMNETYQIEEFLPRDVIGIGLTSSHSIICLSLREDDFGSVYYWYYNWHQPWASEHFEQKIAAVQESIPDFEEVVEKGEGEEFELARDEINYATLTKLGESFTDFINAINIVPVDERK